MRVRRFVLAALQHHFLDGLGWDDPALASHLEACRRIAASGEPWGAVLEDDMWFSDDAARFLAGWDWIPAGVDLVKLETYGTLTCLERAAIAVRVSVFPASST